MRVLIVDDDNLVALSLKTILETDRQIEVASIGNNGPDAIALYDQLSPISSFWISVWTVCPVWKRVRRY